MTETQKDCRICHKPFLPYPLGEKGEYAFAACKACGSVMAEPWPTQEAIDNLFGEIQPEIVHLPSPETEIAQIKGAIAGIMRNGAGKRFLDVSCRQGYGVMAAKELGFQAHGIDPHDFFIEFAKDKYDPHLFEHISAQDYAAKGGQADFIYSAESLCEQTDPESFAAALAKILAPGGTLYLHEPDGNHWRLPGKFAKWDFVDPPLNFSYLSKKGLGALLARHGLKVKEAPFTWTPFMRVVAGHAK
jgi:SAM-dependent methyltransferase